MKIKNNIATVVILAIFTSSALSAFAESPSYVKPKPATLTAHQAVGGSPIGQFYLNSKLEVLEVKDQWTKVKLEAWVKSSDITPLVDQAQVKAAQADALVLVDYKIQTYSEPTNKVYLGITVKNQSTAIIPTWKAFLVAKDITGKEVFRTVITDDTANMAPGATKETGFYWETTDPEYDMLKGAKKDDFTFAVQGAIIK